MIFIILLFALIGIYMLTGRGSFLIAGYNLMSEADKAKYNKKRLCQFVGVLLLFTACFITLMEYTDLGEHILMISFILIIFVSLLLMNFSKVFRSDR
ncbi:DUF3784 domain-containing protein [Macrococcoides bohemicum]|uniref:DUF3784 domain-containing protein n=1 Tax=Macrococcoides bohemicum TaxID=1903056 RepID=A0A328A318_9STAP|nr:MULTISPECIES: DUF3784 domain-containing protein [Macrococcus]QRN49630.1 DUF3784 domain-containing protein [Macrococcus bohemicus]QYA45755.1 DUF3784 domain-containing protein [Macrococcus bohemicus]RAK48933.1 DUF3784 domain-containing protein [Macrococcus bohemicus]